MLTDPRLDPTKRADLTRELHQVLAALETTEEKEARDNLSVHERRDAFGVRPPVLAKPELAVYEETWAPWETPLYDLAHEQGLPAEQVRGLRDEAIKLGQMIGDRGKPATADELKQVFERLKVPAASRPALVKLWERLQGAAE